MANTESQPYQGSTGGTSNHASTPQVALPVRVILRIKENPEFGTFGVMVDEDRGIPIHTTLERVWKNNEPFVSCIPEGEYLCKRWHSAKHPNTFEITGIKGRTACLFHRGNIDDLDSEGCILIGENFDPVYNKKTGRQDYGILGSAAGFAQFLEGLKSCGAFKLIIRRV